MCLNLKSVCCADLLGDERNKSDAGSHLFFPPLPASTLSPASLFLCLCRSAGFRGVRGLHCFLVWCSHGVSIIWTGMHVLRHRPREITWEWERHTRRWCRPRVPWRQADRHRCKAGPETTRKLAADWERVGCQHPTCFAQHYEVLTLSMC